MKNHEPLTKIQTPKELMKLNSEKNKYTEARYSSNISKGNSSRAQMTDMIHRNDSNRERIDKMINNNSILIDQQHHKLISLSKSKEYAKLASHIPNVFLVSAQAKLSLNDA